MKVFILIFLLPLCVFSQTITWDGGGDKKTWHDPDNWDTNTIPCAICDVVIDNGQVILEKDANVKSLEVKGNSKESTFDVNGRVILTISNATSDGFHVDDEAYVTIMGKIDINQSGANGVSLNDGTIRIFDAGFLEVNNSSDLGLSISVTGTVLLEPDADIPLLLIENSLESGIGNDGVIINYGSIAVNSSTDYGVKNIGEFKNYETFSILTAGLQGVYNMGTGAHFETYSGSSNQINGTDDGVLNTAYFKNAGSLTITNSIDSDFKSTAGTVINSGNMYLNNAGDTGILLSGNDFTNTSYISINSPVASGIHTSSKTVNSGTILIQGTFPKGIINENNTDSLINNGTLSIDYATSVAILNTGSYSRFKNTNQCIIKSSNGFFINEGKIINSGSMDLAKDNGTGGIGIYNTLASSSFINSGTLDISESNIGVYNLISGSAFRNIGSGELVFMDVNYPIITNGLFYNNSECHMNYSSLNAIEINSTGEVLNDFLGVLTIDSVGITSGSYGILNNGKLENKGELAVLDKSSVSILSNTNDFFNEGVINFKGPQLRAQRLENSATGVIKGDLIFITGGQLINDGELLELNKLIADTLVNSGFIHIPKGQIVDTYIVNELGGEIVIDSTDYEFITSQQGSILASFKIINKGNITINSSPVNAILFSTPDSLVNDGLLTIKNTETGINYTGGATYHTYNMSNGVMDFDAISAYAINTSGNVRNDGNVIVNHANYGFRTQNYTAGILENNGNIHFKNSTYGTTQFSQFLNNSGASLTLDSCDYPIIAVNIINSGLIDMKELDKGIQTSSLTNHGEILGHNVSNYLLISPTTNPMYFYNNQNALIAADSVNVGLKISDDCTNYGDIIISVAQTAISGPLHNYGNVKVKHCDIALTGGIINKGGGVILIDTANQNYITENEICGYIKTTGSFVSQTINYGFLSRSDPNKSNFRIKNYGVLENRVGIRKGQFFENHGLITGIINGKPSYGIKELNAAYETSGAPFKLTNLYNNESLNAVAAYFTTASNTILVNQSSLNLDTLYAPVSYGQGCQTILKIPVRQSPNCGGVYRTATLHPTGYVYGSGWQTPESWVEEIVPDGCTKVMMNYRVIIPEDTKARAHSIETLGNGIFEARQGAVLDVNPFN